MKKSNNTIFIIVSVAVGGRTGRRRIFSPWHQENNVRIDDRRRADGSYTDGECVGQG
jgi:hypothetical protein